MFQFHTGTMTRRSEKLDQEAAEAYVEIHPDDAARIGLNGEKRVRVASRRGEIELGVRLTPRAMSQSCQLALEGHHKMHVIARVVIG